MKYIRQFKVGRIEVKIYSELPIAIANRAVIGIIRPHLSELDDEFVESVGLAVADEIKAFNEDILAVSVRITSQNDIDDWSVQVNI